jgi:tryptophan synthase alpha chain
MSPASSKAVSRIAGLFEKKRAAQEPVFIAYLTAGDPSPSRTASLALALEKGGVDLLELGVPFSDPVADGPVIQAASDRALAAGTTLAGVLKIAAEIRAKSQMPLLLFSYLNPLLRYGFEKLAKDARAAGIDGVLIIDLSLEEADEYLPPLRAAGLDTVFLATPTSSEERIAVVARRSTGFVYLVSRLGVTGVRDQLSADMEPLVASARKATDLPIAVGFGISRPEQAAGVARLADGVVVGSAVMRVVDQWGADPALEAKLTAFARDLKDAMEAVRQ